MTKTCKTDYHDHKDSMVISLTLSAWLSAITGWYLYALDYFKSNEKSKIKIK